MFPRIQSYLIDIKSSDETHFLISQHEMVIFQTCTQLDPSKQTITTKLTIFYHWKVTLYKNSTYFNRWKIGK